MKSTDNLVKQVRFHPRNTLNRLVTYPKELRLIGQGRSAYVFQIESQQKAVKVFFPEYSSLAERESSIYQLLKGSPSFPEVFESGSNYILMEYIDGNTFYDCLQKGIKITPSMVQEVDRILEFARCKGLNPSDIHLRNIILTKNGSVRMIDVARFKQKGHCHRWDDLKSAFELYYQKPLFPKKIPSPILEYVAKLYKKGKLTMFLKSNFV